MKTIVRRNYDGFLLLALSVVLLASGCAGQQPPPSPAASVPTAPTAPSPPPVQPYDTAVLTAATTLLGNATVPLEGRPPQPSYAVVIDPLIDGMTGVQSITTQSMGARLANLMRDQYPQFDVQPFSASNVAQRPLVLIGTFTGVDAQRKTAGLREAYRICLALADLQTGKIVSKGLAFALPDGVDPTPLAVFRDAPAWSEDPATDGYIRTCQGTKAGDPINPAYLDRIVAAALVAEATEAYHAGRYRDALDLYTSASSTPGGDQYRVHNGIYLANWKLGRQSEAETAFARIVDYGLAHQRLAVKFLFRPGATVFVSDPRLSGPYPVWLKTIATRAAATGSCLEITGHSSPTGPEPLNERLSLLRAEFVKSRLAAQEPSLGQRMIAHGVGSQQTLVGNGRDDVTDALDRRVEFKVIGC